MVLKPLDELLLALSLADTRACIVCGKDEPQKNRNYELNRIWVPPVFQTFVFHSILESILFSKSLISISTSLELIEEPVC